MPSTASTTFDALKPIAGRALEGLLNRLLALDPEIAVALDGLEGRRIELMVQAPPLALELVVRAGRFAIGPANTSDADPDLSVRGTLGGLLAQLPFLRRNPVGGVGKVRIAGDAELARQLQRLAERFDPDWNLPFTSLFGDILGVQIASGLRAALRAGRDGATQFARNGAEFLTEESGDVVGRAELEAYLDDVDVLRDRVERLAARLQRLQRKLPDTADSPDRNGTGA